MNFSLRMIGGIAFCLAQASPAASVGGEVGTTSRTSVRISVKVAPRFRIQRAEGAAEVAPALGQFPLDIASNAPSLRYSIVTQPDELASSLRGGIGQNPQSDGRAGGCGPSQRSAGGCTLVLVVPD